MAPPEEDLSWLLWAYVPDEPAAMFVLDPARSPYLVGRAEAAPIRLAHGSVSRQHAELTAEAGGWRVRDLGSKNGVRFGGHRVSDEGIRADEWFVIGDVYCRLQRDDPDAARARAIQVTRRRELSRAEAASVAGIDEPDAMFARLVEAFAETAGCRRGYVLIGERSDRLVVRACTCPDAQSRPPATFDGSTSVVERALRDRRPILVGDASSLPWLRQRPSVVGQGIRAAVCLPLISESALLGALYADTDEAGRQFTTLDAEVLAEWAHQAVMLRVAQALGQRIDALARCMVAGAREDAAGATEAPPPPGTTRAE